MPNSPNAAIDDKYGKLIDMISDLKNSQNKIISSINSCREGLKLQDKKLASFDSRFDLLSNQITSVMEDNKLLKSRIEQLESKLSIVEHAQSTFPPINQDNFFAELMDRQSRVRNIILFNVPDRSTSSTDLGNDANLVDEMFNVIGVPTKPVSVHRLGKPSSKPRPIRVVMPLPSDVFQILKTKRQLSNVDKFKTIRVSSDQTLQQRKLYSSIASELKARKDRGETDIFIKFVNNCPTISKNGRAAQL